MPGRTLVIETATAACSVALIEGDAVIDQSHEIVGRGHAEHLVPMIAALVDGGRADRILVDVGPGSFTGVRVGLAAARGLGLGWRAPVAGYSSMVLLAATALAIDPRPLAVVLEGGHGELFVQCFDAAPFRATASLASLPPAEALRRIGDLPAVGSGVRWLDRDHVADRETLPRAADAVLLSAADASLSPSPLYGRAPDAKPLMSGVKEPTATR